VRTTDDQEVRLGSYEMFHRGEPLTETVWEKLMLLPGAGNVLDFRAVLVYTLRQSSHHADLIFSGSDVTCM
jgi:hypothetical protein